MDKSTLLQKLSRAGDAVLILDTSEKHNLEKEFLCTINFDNEYINKRQKGKFNTRNNVLVFSWTDNCFRLINPNAVKKIIPLSTILGNVRNG